MKKIAIEMSKDLRQAFKAACALNGVSMRDALVEETNEILNTKVSCYNTNKPEDNLCVLCLNMDELFLQNIRQRKRDDGDRLRDIYITAIINYLNKNNSTYDYSGDICEE